MKVILSRLVCFDGFSVLLYFLLGCTLLKSNLYMYRTVSTLLLCAMSERASVLQQ